MEILFMNEALGKIENLCSETFWITGNFSPYDSYFKYKEFLDALVNEDGFDETKFDEALLDENNWFVRDMNGIKGIVYPAIYYDDRSVSIRYR